MESGSNSNEESKTMKVKSHSKVKIFQNCFLFRWDNSLLEFPVLVLHTQAVISQHSLNLHKNMFYWISSTSRRGSAHSRNFIRRRSSQRNGWVTMFQQMRKQLPKFMAILICALLISAPIANGVSHGWPNWMPNFDGQAKKPTLRFICAIRAKLVSQAIQTNEIGFSRKFKDAARLLCPQMFNF